MYITLDKSCEIKCTLGTIREIEKSFGKGFYEIMKNIDKLTIAEQIRLIYVGVIKGGSSVGENEFAELCDEFLGMGSLQEILETYLYQLQYPGLSDDEIKEKIQKKLSQAKANSPHTSLGESL